MNPDIMHYAPKTWDIRYECAEFRVGEATDEFFEVESDLLRAIKNAKRLKKLTRVQNVYDFGQFLMRSQIVVKSDSDNKLYKVRRYVSIPRNQRYLAVKHNLDHRRLNMDEIEFKSHLNYVSPANLIFVVRILSHDERARNIKPYNFTEYYIEYVAEMEYLY